MYVYAYRVTRTMSQDIQWDIHDYTNLDVEDECITVAMHNANIQKCNSHSQPGSHA